MKVIVSDFDGNAPAFRYCDFISRASTFDREAVLADARKFNADCLMTTGTDQPVLTAAAVSEKLGLPYFLTVEQALKVTNKKVMKEAFLRHDIPTASFRLLKDDFEEEDLAGMSFPLVIKPLDSQGQRGVMKVHTIAEIRENFSTLLGFSREREILAEEYYPSAELTVNGWAVDGKAMILMITDRVTVDNGPHIGVCVSHRYPSLHHGKEGDLQELVQRITTTIGLKNGPLYFQILAGEKGFMVNEIACRLGGAYEDEFIPFMTGFPLMENMIELTRGGNLHLPGHREIDSRLEGKYLSLQMFFAAPGILSRQEGMDRVLKIPGMRGGRFLLPEGAVVRNRANSTQRAGYFIVTGSSPRQINDRIQQAYNILVMEDSSGKSMIQLDERMYFPDEI